MGLSLEGFGGGFEIRKMAFELRDLKKKRKGRRRKRAKRGFFLRRLLAR